MAKQKKQLSNPTSTGGGGYNFEAKVQAAFVALMLTGGYAPCLQQLPIIKVMLQAQHAGYQTDDLVVFAGFPDSQQRRLLAQVKRTMAITNSDPEFGKVIADAWCDFNNAQAFTKGRDAIAVITGPISATDIKSVRPLLELARVEQSAEEFIRKVELANYCSQQQREKLKVFRTKLKDANDQQEVSDDSLWQFLNHFHLLGYDLDVKAGVSLSLLHSVLATKASADIGGLWRQIIEEVQYRNEHGGTITVDTLPEELTKVFRQPEVLIVPEELEIRDDPKRLVRFEWDSIPYAPQLAFANLFGSWNEHSKSDKGVIETITNATYDNWIGSVRGVLHQGQAGVLLRRGVWEIQSRLSLWEGIGKHLIDSDLEKFNRCAVQVLAERHPGLELPKEDRFAASVYGRKLKYSNAIRKGMADTLALLGTRPNELRKCSPGKPEAIAADTVLAILKNADWQLWASLYDLLPLLAEAAPNAFLLSLENALQTSPNPFDVLFSEEGDGITGSNYMVGVLWALEALAWREDNFVRVVMLLGELAARDPGGHSGNRPLNSLTAIFLPWLPQTEASFKMQAIAINALSKEYDDIAWKLLLTLFPSSLQTSMPTHKLRWSDTAGRKQSE